LVWEFGREMLTLYADVSITGYKLGPNGWDFTPEEEGCTPDPVNNFPHTKAIYLSVEPSYNLRYTIPILYDKKTNQIVNNESSEIIRFFNSEFDEFVAEKYKGIHFYPEKLSPEIDSLNEWV
jgi:putative glutathione S-transferase